MVEHRIGTREEWTANVIGRFGLEARLAIVAELDVGVSEALPLGVPVEKEETLRALV
jgi:hypothetical protein